MPIRDLFSHAWQHSSAQRRLTAVRGITDQRLLEKIACRGSHADVRLTAVLKLTDEEALIRAIERSNDDEVRTAALARLSNEGRARIVSSIRLAADLRRQAFEAITLPATRTRVTEHLHVLLYQSPSPATLERLSATGWAPHTDDDRALVAMAWSDWISLVELARRSPWSVRRLIGWENSLRDHVASACLRLRAREPSASVMEDAQALALAVREYQEERWRAEIFERERRITEAWRAAAPRELQPL